MGIDLRVGDRVRIERDRDRDRVQRDRVRKRQIQRDLEIICAVND